MSIQHLGGHRGRLLIHGLVPCPARVGPFERRWLAKGRSRMGSPSSCCLIGRQKVEDIWRCKICLFPRSPTSTHKDCHRKRAQGDHRHNKNASMLRRKKYQTQIYTNLQPTSLNTEVWYPKGQPFSYKHPSSQRTGNLTLQLFPHIPSSP